MRALRFGMGFCVGMAVVSLGLTIFVITQGGWWLTSAINAITFVVLFFNFRGLAATEARRRTASREDR